KILTDCSAETLIFSAISASSAFQTINDRLHAHVSAGGVADSFFCLSFLRLWLRLTAAPRSLHFLRRPQRYTISLRVRPHRSNHWESLLPPKPGRRRRKSKGAEPVFPERPPAFLPVEGARLGSISRGMISRSSNRISPSPERAIVTVNSHVSFTSR